MGNIIGSDVQENTERVKRILSLSSLFDFDLNTNTYNNNKSKSNSNNNRSNSEEDNNDRNYNENAMKPTRRDSENNILGGYRKKKSRSKKGLRYKKKRLNKKK